MAKLAMLLGYAIRGTVCEDQTIVLAREWGYARPIYANQSSNMEVTSFIGN